MPRFVVLEHVPPGGRHWDFMLETGGVLATWALAQAPDAAAFVAAEPLPDHRLVYLDFEGPISGGRGSVTRWDQGTFEFTRQSPTEVAVLLRGGKLLGRAALERSEKDAKRWTFSYVPSPPPPDKAQGGREGV
jgi:DNA polymerase Ligase (LigD)